MIKQSTEPSSVVTYYFHQISVDNEEGSLISDHGIFIFNWIVWAVLAQAVVIFGVVSNIINMICFVKQGFKDSINVSLTDITRVRFYVILLVFPGTNHGVVGPPLQLLQIWRFYRRNNLIQRKRWLPMPAKVAGLAISDLGCLLPLVWANISYTPAFSELDLPFDVVEIQFITSGITHVMLSRISCWITAMITLERCLCVSMPLKIPCIDVKIVAENATLASGFLVIYGLIDNSLYLFLYHTS